MSPVSPIKCSICGKAKRKSHVVQGELISHFVVDEIRKTHPDWSRDGYVCLDDLYLYRNRYVESLLEAERGDLSSIEREVIDSLAEQQTLSENINATFEGRLTFGERLADKIAEFGGSWRFIITFFIFLVVWMSINTVYLLAQPFDPYPFILLNLILSSLAALQAPVIMMSQNRQEAKDRLRSESEYQINLKAELEIRHLHLKIDHMASRQFERLMEIQEIQMDLMNQLNNKKARSPDSEQASSTGSNQ